MVTILSRIFLITVGIAANLAAAFEPRIEGTRLRVDSLDVKPSRVVSPWQPEYTKETYSIRTMKNVIHVRAQNSSTPRIARLPEKRRVVWLGTDSHIAIFVRIPQPRPHEGIFPSPNPTIEPTIYRLDLDSMEWLSPLRIGSTDSHQNHDGTAKSFCSLGKVAVSNGVLAVLTYSGAETPEPGYPSVLFKKASAYKVSLFQLRGSKPEWERRFEWHGTKREVPSVDLGIAAPSYMKKPITELLTWIPRRNGRVATLLVCAGEKEDVLCLSAIDGNECWRIERIWEFSRDYIGPSAFEYFICRLGMDLWTVEPESVFPKEVNASDEEVQRQALKIAVAEARKQFYSIYDGRIAAGPVLVPEDASRRSFRVFIGVARDPRNGCPRGQPNAMVAEGLVYELDAEHGEVEAMTRLPRCLVPRPYHVLPGGLISSCERGYLVRLGLSTVDFSRGFTFSENDMLCRIAWYRELPFRQTAAWFLAEAEPGIVCFSNELAFRADLAFVRTPEDKVYHFLITAVDLQSGVPREVTLEVPFEGDFTLPEGGKATFSGTVRASEPHLLRIANLQTEGDVLHVTMDEIGKRSVRVSFDLSAIGNVRAEHTGG